MKKLLTIAAICGAASASFGQGFVSFANGTAAATHISTNSVPNGAATGQIGTTVGSYYFALFVAPTNTLAVDNSLTGWTYLSGVGTNSGVLGRFTGNTSTDGFTVAGYASGATANFVVVGWSSNIGTSWAQAQAWFNQGSPATAGWFSISSIAYGTIVGGGPTPVPAIFGPNPGQIGGPDFAGGTHAGGMVLNYYTGTIPEPSTFALAGLGAAALLIFRKRK
jgi:hypothetical protein